MSFDNNLTLILDKRNFSIKDDIGNASNTTSNNDADDPNFGQHNITAIVVLTLIYGLLSLTACVGNLLVIWIIAKGRRMRTVMNLYIGNLALADVTIAVLYIPFQFQAALLNRWNLPSFMCKLCPFVQHLCINASIFTLVIIALDRYRGIIWPLKGGYSKFRAKLIVVCVWVVAVTPATPNLIVFHVITNDQGTAICTPNMGNLSSNVISVQDWNTYNIMMVLLQYPIPLFIISLTYGHMARVLWSMSTPGQAYEERDVAILENKRKVTKMLSIVVILFGICWLPYQSFNFLISAHVDLSFPGINYIWMAGHVLAMSNSCVNPFIYAIYNDKFRQEFKRKWADILGKSIGPSNLPAGWEAENIGSRPTLRQRMNYSEGMILQTRNSSSKLVKKDSSSSIRYPLPLKRFASVKSNFQTNSSNRSKLSLNVLSEIQEKEQSISDETRNQLSAIKAADNSHSCRNNSLSENGNCIGINIIPVNKEDEENQDINTQISPAALNRSGPEAQEEINETNNKCSLSSLKSRTSSAATVVPDMNNHVINHKQDSIKHSKTCSASLYIFNSKGKRCATVTNDYVDNQLGCDECGSITKQEMKDILGNESPTLSARESCTQLSTKRKRDQSNKKKNTGSKSLRTLRNNEFTNAKGGSASDSQICWRSFEK